MTLWYEIHDLYLTENNMGRWNKNKKAKKLISLQYWQNNWNMEGTLTLYILWWLQKLYFNLFERTPYFRFQLNKLKCSSLNASKSDFTCIFCLSLKLYIILWSYYNNNNNWKFYTILPFRKKCLEMFGNSHRNLLSFSMKQNLSFSY